MNKEYIEKRRNALYNYLIDKYDDISYISKLEICNDLSSFYQHKDGETRLCRVMEDDVRCINSNNLYEKIIVSNKYGYKIGNKLQVENYIKRLFKRDLKSLKRNYLLTKKKGLDGQLNIYFEEIKTFMKGENNG